jgi:hypothetical protein
MDLMDAMDTMDPMDRVDPVELMDSAGSTSAKHDAQRPQQRCEAPR